MILAEEHTADYWVFITQPASFFDISKVTRMTGNEGRLKAALREFPDEWSTYGHYYAKPIWSQGRAKAMAEVVSQFSEVPVENVVERIRSKRTHAVK